MKRSPTGRTGSASGAAISRADRRLAHVCRRLPEPTGGLSTGQSAAPKSIGPRLDPPTSATRCAQTRATTNNHQCFKRVGDGTLLYGTRQVLERIVKTARQDHDKAAGQSLDHFG